MVNDFADGIELLILHQLWDQWVCSEIVIVKGVFNVHLEVIGHGLACSGSECGMQEMDGFISEGFGTFVLDDCSSVRGWAGLIKGFVALLGMRGNNGR